MRITDQYFWNVVLSLFFIGFLFMGTVILEGDAYKPFATLTLADYVIMVLATFRLVRLFLYDKITAFFREQFYDVAPGRGSGTLVKPEFGPRRTIVDLMSCPWCFGLWAAGTVSFFYLLSPHAFYPIMLLAIGAAGSLLQIIANAIGWKAEQLKMDTDDR